MAYQQQWQVPSQSSKGKKMYTVSLRHDGTFECACMNWTRTVPREDCKHILKVRCGQVKSDQTLLGVITGNKVMTASGRVLSFDEPEFETVTEPTGRRFRDA